MQTRTLPIDGYKGRMVPNTLYRPEEWSGHLAIFYPDVDYPTDWPLFYYVRLLLLAAGADVLTVDYDYARSNQSRFGADTQHQFLDDVVAAWQTARLYDTADRVTLVGKSFGTFGIAHLLMERMLPDEVEIVWITPPLEAASLVETLRDCTRRSLAVIGRPAIAAEESAAAGLMENVRLTLKVFEGADEKLEREGDVAGSVRILAEFVETVSEFLDLRAPRPDRRLLG